MASGSLSDPLPESIADELEDISKNPLQRWLSIPFTISWEWMLIGVIFFLAVFMRLWGLGARVMSHDESLHVYYSWQLATGGGFIHNPMMHGPSLFEATALMDFLFGANDFTSRLVPAILGVFIVVAIPQLLKPWLGRLGALAVSALLLISPYILFYSRYIRHDIQVIAWALLAILAIFRYLEDRRFSDLILLAFALALMFSTMEISFFYLAVLAGYLALRILAKYSIHWRAIRSSAEFDLLVVICTLGAFFSSPIALLVLNPVWSRISGAPFVDLKLLDSQGLGWAVGPAGLRLWGLLAAFSLASLAVGLWWDVKRWPKLAGIFLAITTTLFSTLWSNPAGIGTGFIGSLGYWLSQQNVARGSQPWYFYTIVFSLYEYLPLVGGILAAGFYVFKGKNLSAFSHSFVPFLLLWALGIYFGLSLAGEKMPWLSTHITIPLILLTGWFIGQLLESSWAWGKSLKENLRPAGKVLLLSGLAVLALMTLRTSLVVNYADYDYSTEYVDYAHGAPGVKWVMSDLQAIANHTGIGRDLKIAYDSEVSWPMSWYLRDYPNRVFYGEQPNRQALDAQVVIAGPKDWSKVEATLKDRYHRFEVIRIWWPIEDYKNLTWSRIRYAITNPAMRSALWDIFWQRDYSRYAQLTGQAISPPTAWPLSERMRIYIRKDIALQMLSLNLGKSMLEDLTAPVDPYQAVTRKAMPEKMISQDFNTPRNMAIGPDSSIYVADTGNSRIVKLNSEGSPIASWGSRTPDGQNPPAAGSLREPWGIAVDVQGKVYVADTWNHRVQIFDADGKFLQAWGTAGQAGARPGQAGARPGQAGARPGQAGGGPGQAGGGPGKAGGGQELGLWGPRGITVSPDGRVYLTDTGNKRVVVFDADGKFLFDFGKQGEGQLDEPVGIAIGPSGKVYVADTWNSRVAVFSLEGKFLTSWPVEGWLGESLDNKPYLAVDGEGRVYITDPEAFRVIVFSAEGAPLTAFGQYGPEEDSFALPIGVAIAPDGTVWISDAGNNRLVNYILWKKP